MFSVYAVSAISQKVLSPFEADVAFIYFVSLHRMEVSDSYLFEYKAIQIHVPLNVTKITMNIKKKIK